MDFLGIFAAPTEAYFKLHPPKQTKVTTGPDRTLHEARKFAELAVQCNPTVLELLWLNSYTTTTDAGEELVQIRRAFLSAFCVRNAYLGYATQQFKRAQRHEDGTPDERKAKVAKNARHLLRLLVQGTELWLTGTMQIELPNPGRVHDFGQQVADGSFDEMRKELATAERIFDMSTPRVPLEANLHAVEMWLLNVRVGNLSGSHIGNDYDASAA